MGKNLNKPMPPLDNVIAKLGLRGDTDLANRLNLAKSTVTCWRYANRRGDMAGTIPARYHAPILKIAKSLGVTLSTSDMVPTMEDQTAA